MDCSKCDGKCCKYVALEIDTPEDLEDFENIKWYVVHKNVNIYVEEDGIWNLEFITPCEYLGENNLCKIYNRRPDICRDYNQEECTFHNDYNEKYSFKKIEDVEKYIEEVYKKGLHIIPDDEDYDEDDEDYEEEGDEDYDEDDEDYEEEGDEDYDEDSGREYSGDNSGGEQLVVEEREVSVGEVISVNNNNDNEKKEEKKEEQENNL